MYNLKKIQLLKYENMIHYYFIGVSIIGESWDYDRVNV